MTPFTDGQRCAVESNVSRICVSAGAGSGKTRILIHRIVRLLAEASLWPESGPQLDRIVAITFMEKAAAEMKARLRKAFRDKASSEDTDRYSMNFWREMERRVDTARISTIHAFCSGFLRRNALYIGMPPDWQVLDDMDTDQLAEQAVTQTLQRLLEGGHPAAARLCLQYDRKRLGNLLRHLLEKRAAFRALSPERHQNPHPLTVYWRGTLPELHEAYLASRCWDPEIRYHLEALLAGEGICAEDQAALEEHRTALVEFLTNLTLSCGPLREKLARLLALLSNRKRVKRHSDASETLKGVVDQAKKWAINELGLPEMEEEMRLKTARTACDLYAVAGEALIAYDRAKRALPALDYDDMIWETLRALREHPNLRAKTARDIRFLLMDEFQDTDPGQMEIVRLLREEPEGPHTFVVGDAKQSIYYFRGANVRLFQDEMAAVSQLVELRHNFRAVPNLLHFINDFFAGAGLLAPVGAYQPMEAHRLPAEKPCLEFFVSVEGPNGKAPNAVEQRKQEAAYVAARIRSLCEGPDPLRVEDARGGGKRPATYGDMALLFRRSSFMHVYEQALRAAGIPYTRISGAGFFECREILDMAALLQWLADPWDEEAMLTVLRSPLVGLSDDSLAWMTRKKPLADAFFAEAPCATRGQAEVLEYARTLFDHLYRRRHLPPAALIRNILEYTRFEAALLAGFLGAQKVSNLRKLVRIAETFGAARSATLAEFARHIQNLRLREIREGEAPLLAEGAGAVLLLTVHKAKGLEFPVVFLPEMGAEFSGSRGAEIRLHPELGLTVKAQDEWLESKHTPESKLAEKIHKAHERAEEWRALYVAMTRARDYLALCGAPKPKRNSWFYAVNRYCKIEGRRHGNVLQGADWAGIVNREAPVLPDRVRVSPPEADHDPARIAMRIAPLPDTDAGVTLISVSHLLDRLVGSRHDWEERGSREFSEPDAEPSESDRAFAMARGQLAHRLFEGWDFKSDTCPSCDALLSEIRFGLRRRAVLEKYLRHIIRRFRESEYFPRFAGAERVLREQPFLLDIGPALMHGVIDALLDDEILVDYKTGKPSPERERGYQMQLMLYAAAVRAFTGKLPRQALLWYAVHGVMRAVPLDAPSIDRLLAHAREKLRDPYRNGATE